MLQALIPFLVGGAGGYGHKKMQERKGAATDVLFKMMEGQELTEEDKQVLSALGPEGFTQAVKAVDAFSKITKMRQAGEPIPETIRNLFPNIPEGTTGGQLAGLPGAFQTRLAKETPTQEWRGGMEKYGATIIDPAMLGVSPGRVASPEESLLAQLSGGAGPSPMEAIERIPSEHKKYGPRGLVSLFREAIPEGMFRAGTGELKAKPKPIETGPKSTLYKEFADFKKLNPDWQGNIFDYLRKKKAIEGKKALTPSEKKTEKQRQRQFVLKLYGESEWNKLEPDIAQRALQVINRADELMVKDPVMSFNKAAQTAFNEDPENLKAALLKQYPNAYQGGDGQWYIDKDGKTFRINPKRQ